MIGMKDHPWIACSPDGMALIDSSKAGFSSTELVMASVEIKTSVAQSSVDRSLTKSSQKALNGVIGHTKFAQMDLKQHAGQLVQQATVENVDYVVYVSASENTIIYIIVV